MRSKPYPDFGVNVVCRPYHPRTVFPLMSNSKLLGALLERTIRMDDRDPVDLDGNLLALEEVAEHAPGQTATASLTPP
jgi:hypothetical protein